MEKPFQDTTATQKIFNLTKRIRAVSGGTWASKTVSILVWIIDYCQSADHQVVTIVAESFPHLNLGAIRDFKNILVSNGYWLEDHWNEGQHVYKFPKTESIVEFVSFDKFGKAHGPRRDVLFINEANNIPWTIADQLITRTRKIVWLDLNPSEEFWFYTEMLPVRKDLDFITLTYKDNEALDEIAKQEILSHKTNKAWWTVYGLGQLGEILTRIYTGWGFLDEIPAEAKLERRWLDFGYKNDPTAIGEIYRWNRAYILNERLYQKGLSNQQIGEALLNYEEPETLVIADSAEPKSIDELIGYGLNIVPSRKGKDSVRHGIQLVQQQKIFVTNHSLNIKKEYRNYLWDVDKNGKILKVPAPGFDHHMDGIRYGFESFLEIASTMSLQRQEEHFIRTQIRQNLNSAK